MDEERQKSREREGALPDVAMTSALSFLHLNPSFSLNPVLALLYHVAPFYCCGGISVAWEPELPFSPPSPLVFARGVTLVTPVYGNNQ